MSDITLYSLWRENSTGDLVQVHWVSNKLVCYTKAKTHPKEIRTVKIARKFAFLQDFTKEIQYEQI